MKHSLTSADRQWLQDRFGPAAKFDEPMAHHTWLRIGGPAEAFVVPATIAELTALVCGCRERGLPLLTLGGGTNLLVADGGIPGVVVSTARCLERIEPPAIRGEVARVSCMAGVKLPALVRYTVENGLGGLTFAAGIPGSAGGAAVMNAGTRQGCMADVVDRLELLNTDGTTASVDRNRLDFGYRSLSWSRSSASRAAVVLRIGLRLYRQEREILQQEMDGYLKSRNRSQPTNLASAGCFFKNPSADRPAGLLIDRAGLKGLRIGGAQVSARHANFIVNTGGARAADVLELMERIRQTVFDRFQIMLEPEVTIVGRQTEPKKSFS